MTGTRRGSLSAGFAALSHGKLILLLALSTALLGLLGALPLTPALADATAGTLAGDHVLRNHATFAPTDFLDFLREREFAVQGARRSALGVGILAVVLQVFFAGGILGALGRGRFTFGQFADPARRHFWHNAKCFVLFALAGSVVLGVWFGGEGAIAKKALENVPPDAALRFAVRWGSIGVGVLLFGALSLLYDFARAARRYAPTIGAWRSVAFALRALRGSWLRALALFLFWLILGSAVVFATVAAVWCMPAVSLPAVLLLLLLQFAALWLRAAVRVAAWGSYLGFLDPRARTALASLQRVSFGPR